MAYRPPWQKIARTPMLITLYALYALYELGFVPYVVCLCYCFELCTFQFLGIQ